MPFDGNNWSDKKLIPYQEMLNIIEKRFGKLEKVEDGPNDTAKGMGPTHRVYSLLENST